MTRQLASIVLAALLTALSPIEVSIAQAKQSCSAAMPSDPHGHWWSYRLIDGRKCWYEGKPGLSKSLLEWPEEVSARPASGEEAKSTVPEKEVVTSTVPEKAGNPLDSQAWAPSSKSLAPSDPGTFEAQWRARTVEGAASTAAAGPTTPKADDRPPLNKIEGAASITDAGPGTPDADDRPPLKKADKLQSPDFDSVQPKVTRTIVIVPDRPLAAPTGLSRHTGASLPAPSVRTSPSARE